MTPVADPLGEASSLARELTVDIRGRPVHVSLEGRGEGLALLLINGLGGTVATWRPLRHELVAHRTIAFDAPGCGRSPAPPLPVSIPGAARHVTRLLDALGERRVDVLGFSLGGLVAQQLAWTAPGRVRRLAVMSTNMGWGSLPGGPRTIGALLSLRRLHDADHYAQMAPDLLGGRMRRDPALVRQVAEARTADPPSSRSYAGQLLSCASWSTLPFLPLIRQPTLVLNGDDDPMARLVNARVLARLVPRGRLHVVRGGGHHLVLERPAEVAAVLAEFLEAPEP